jgi:DNA-binding IclR family transcriptional regulator
MEEQIVRYSEQLENQGLPGTSPVAGVPAPMVERAFRLLDLLSDAEEGLTLTDLARALAMSKGSMHGLLRTLESSGVIEQVEERRYVLGARIYDLAQAYIQRAGLRRFAVPAMRRLAANTGETVCLGKVEQKGVRIVECVIDEGEHSALHISAMRGQRIPLLAAATGTVVLANWPASQRESYLQGHSLPQFTAHSATDPQQFLARVEETARGGIGYDHEEYLVGVNAIAAPVYGVGDALVGLLWIVGFASRFNGEALANAGRQLRAEAAGVSRALGSGKA